MRMAEQLKQKNVKKEAQILESIPIDAVRPNPYQPRRTFSEDGIDELSRSIRQFGLLQPITVRKVGKAYELVMGERRLRACRRAGFTSINAIIVNSYEQESALMAMIENLQRENLHFLEEAEGYYNLLKDHRMTQEELARRVGKTQSTIANKLRILKLSHRVRESVTAYRLTERHARALLRLPEEDMQLKIIDLIRQKSLSVQATEMVVQKYLDRIYDMSPHEHQGAQVKRVIRSSRIFVNSIRNVVQEMRHAGIDTKISESESEGMLHINICVPITYKFK